MTFHSQNSQEFQQLLSTNYFGNESYQNPLNTNLNLFQARSAALRPSGLVVRTTDENDTRTGSHGNDVFIASKGNDVFTGNGGQDRFLIRLGDGTKTITDFGGVGRGVNPSHEVIANVDTLQFVGEGLTATNMQLTQNGADLEVTFFGVKDSPKVILKNFSLENLDNLNRSTGASVDIGNILFNGDKAIQDSFDVFDANATPNVIFNRNATTFVNDLDNQINGFDHSVDVINALGGNDVVNSLSGDDWVRGGLGSDTINAGDGNDYVQGDGGQDTMSGGNGYDRFIFDKLAIAGGSPVRNAATGIEVKNLPPDIILDFNVAEDQFGLSSDLGLQNIHFQSGLSSQIFGNRNVIVLQDAFANAAAAANAIANNNVITSDEGVFVYFNSTLGISRLVYSKDLSDGGEITVMANLTNQTNVEGQKGFDSKNFTLI